MKIPHRTPTAAVSRPARIAPAVVTLTVALVAGGVAAWAHDFCLLPGAPVAGPGAPFDLAMHLAEVFPGETVPWRTGRIVSLSLSDARGRTDLEAPPLAGEPPVARITLRTPGTAVLALVTDPSYIELAAAEFQEYLEHEGHAAAIEARRKAGQTARPGRERYTRHVKTIVNATGPSGSVALTRVGMALEIVPETDLAAIAPGGTLPVRVFFRDEAYADAPICATHDGRSGGPDYTWCGRLDGAGRAKVPIEAAGWQMIRVAKMVPVHNDAKADWHSYWSNLTFHVAAPTPPAAPESAP